MRLESQGVPTVFGLCTHIDNFMNILMTKWREILLFAFKSIGSCSTAAMCRLHPCHEATP